MVKRKSFYYSFSKEKLAPLFFVDPYKSDTFTPFGLKLKKNLVQLKGSSYFMTPYGHLRDNWMALTNNELYIYIQKELSSPYKDLYVLTNVSITKMPYYSSEEAHKIQIKFSIDEIVTLYFQ